MNGKENGSNSSLINTRTERILNCFDGTTRDALLDFCKRISEIEADVFILMARKATCFFNCLEELGLIHFNGYVTSERILDMDTAWLSNKSIIIIDDAIVSGTSINRTICKLEKAGVKSIQVHVLSVNDKWFQADMLKDDAGNSYLYPNCNVASNEKCIELCYEVVKAILLQPRPYDIDYPYFNRVKVKTSNFTNVINLCGWDSYDVSTVEQMDNQIYSITLMPSRETVLKYERFVACSAFENCILKIRLYATLNEKNKKTYSVRIVPIIVFDKIESDCIERMFNELIRQSGKDIIKDQFKTLSSKMRLVQFYYSYKLAIFWSISLPPSLGIIGNDLVLEDRNLSFIFPKEIDYEVDELCRSRNAVITVSDVFDFNKHTTPPRSSCIVDKNYIALESRLIEPFVDFYYQKEIPCREIVLKEGKQVFANKEYNDLTQRLNTGINIGELMQTIAYAADVCDIKTKVSLFLDRSIDMGIIVPITQESGKYVYRAYRHGEDVLFGEREKILYMYLLREFQKECKSNSNPSEQDEGITHITLEKMLVIFTKIGIQKKILRPYISNFTCSPKDKSDSVLRVKMALKGPVALLGPVKKHRSTRRIPYITTENKMMWFSKVFSSQNLIKKDASNKYLISDVDTSSILKSDLRCVQDIAIMFGQVCNKNIDTGINFGDEELTKVSTCLTILDCIKAVSAELYIFLQYWNSDLIEKQMFKDENAIIESKRSPSFEALNSAYMKIKAYETGEAEKLVSNVKFVSRIEQNQWNSCFDDIYPSSENADLDKFSNDLYRESKRLSYSLLVLINLLFEALFINYKIDTKSKKTKYISDCENQLQLGINALKQMECDVNDDAKDFISQIESVRDELFAHKPIDESYDISRKISETTIDRICSFIDRCVDDITSHLDDVCASLGSRGHVSQMTVFNHSLAIIYDTQSDEFRTCVEKVVARCYESLLRSISNLDANVSMLNENNIPEDAIYQEDKHVKWLIATGSSAADALAHFAMNLLYVVNTESVKFNLQHHGMSVVYMGDISYKHAIKQPELSPAEFFCNAFYDYIDYIPMSLFKCEEDKFNLKIAIEQSKYDDNGFVSFVKSRKIQNKMEFVSVQDDNKIVELDNTMMLKISSFDMPVKQNEDQPDTDGRLINNITNNYYGPLSDVQIQQGTLDSTQSKTNNGYLTEKMITELIKLIQQYNSELDQEFSSEKANEIRACRQVLENSLQSVNQVSESKKEKAIDVIKDIVTNTFGGVASSAIICLLRSWGLMP